MENFYFISKNKNIFFLTSHFSYKRWMGMINSYYSYRALICWKLLVKENGSGCGSGSNQEYESYQIISCKIHFFLDELYVNYNPHHRNTRS